MQRGTDIHTETEHYLKSGEIRDSCYSEFNLNYRPYVESLAPLLPPPMHDDLIVEHEINIECGPGLPSWVGYIDIGFSGGDTMIIDDLKTTSDFRYAKTEKELATLIQPISYARWAYEDTAYEGNIKLGHIYIKTEKRLVRKKPKTKYVDVEVSQNHVTEIWQEEMVTVAEMVEAARAESVHDLPPTVTACGDYGGCPHAEICGLPAMTLGGLFNLNEKTEKGSEDMGNAFLNRLKNKNKGKEGEVKVLPDDAPSRETSKEDGEKIRAEMEAKKEKAEKAAEKKAAKEAKKAEKARAAKEAEALALAPGLVCGGDDEEPVKKSNGTSSFIVYIDCMPKKNIGGVAPVLFEDWFKPLFDELDKSVATENNSGYWALGFAEQKHLLASAVAMYIDEKGLPASMIVASGTTLMKDVLPCLTPHAQTVVTGIRG